MKIGISVNGEGRGHLSRARALAEILETRYDLSFWAPEHLAGELSAHFPHAEVRTIPYFKFVQRGFNLDYGATVAENAALFVGRGRVSARIARELRESRVDAVLSDFEPFASRAARSVGIPVLQLNHPSVVARSLSLDPETFLQRSIAIAVARFMAGHADKTIVCSFFDGDVGPIIRKALRETKRASDGHFVVSVKPHYRAAIERALDAIGRDIFRVFPDPEADYDRELARSRGLIAPAGHQSISEALALGKPVLAIPVAGQWEQALNAKKLRDSGFGDWANIEDLEAALPRFVTNAGRYEEAIEKSRLSVRHGEGKGFCCEDQTFRAACMVESFLLECGVRAERNRKGLMSALIPDAF